MAGGGSKQVKVEYWSELTNEDGSKTYSLEISNVYKVKKGDVITYTDPKYGFDSSVFNSNYYVGYKLGTGKDYNTAHAQMKAMQVRKGAATTSYTIDNSEYTEIHFYTCDRRAEVEYISQGKQIATMTTDIFKNNEKKVYSATGNQVRYYDGIKFNLQNITATIGGNYTVDDKDTADDDTTLEQDAKEATFSLAHADWIDLGEEEGELEWDGDDPNPDTDENFEFADEDYEVQGEDLRDRTAFTGGTVQSSTSEITINPYNYANENLSNASETGKENEKNRYGDTSIISYNYEAEPPFVVYVRHMQKQSNGTYTLNNNLGLKKAHWFDKLSGGTKYLVNNGFSQRRVYNASAAERASKISAVYVTPSEVTNNYCSEKYTIDKSDQINIPISGISYQDGKKITMDAVKVLPLDDKDYISNTWYINTQTNAVGSSSVTNGFIPITCPNNKNAVVVTIYYSFGGDNLTCTGTECELNLTEDPTIGFEGGAESITCSGKEEGRYAAVKQSISTYIDTPEYFLENVEYDININGYYLKTFETYKLADGSILNTGGMIGTAKTAVFDTSPQIVYNTPINMVAQYNSFKTKIPQTAASTDISWTRKTKFRTASATSIPENKYNGLRTAKGRSRYVKSTINSSGGETLGGSIYVNTVNEGKINIYTPLTLATPTITSDAAVNQQVEGEENNNYIQKDKEFTLTPHVQGEGTSDNYGDISGRLGYYILKFEFRVKTSQDVQVFNAEDLNTISTVASGNYIEKDQYVKLPKGTSFKGTITDASNMQIGYNKFKIYGVTINEPSTISVYRKKYLSEATITKNWNCDSLKERDYGGVDDSGTYIKMNNSANYYVSQESQTTNLARMYDFKLTDCQDVSFKNVFRKATSGNVNEHTNVTYFSGINKLNTLNELTDENESERAQDNVDSRDSSTYTKNGIKCLLPLGPYKNTNIQYIQAPKLGYKFSFDLSTTGAYSRDNPVSRRIDISPTFYYISKDGKSGLKDVEVYYKTSNGNYKKYNTADCDYNITFKPNDGYRRLEASESSEYLSTKNLQLNVGKNTFSLYPNTAITLNQDNYIQTWYGEYKVPNSAIIVANGETNLNNTLSNGYLLVKFDIYSVDYTSEKVISKISYSANDKNDKTNTINTSQWDLEGYMGRKYGDSTDLKLQLEKGTWTIKNNDYQKIKGTVMMYDIDNRAADDFQ